MVTHLGAPENQAKSSVLAAIECGKAALFRLAIRYEEKASTSTVTNFSNNSTDKTNA
jgi:hypothetical protein